MANVFIDIASEFTGKKAFKQAETATEKLTKNVKQLARTFGVAFGTAQVIAYGKASIKAAAADEKAQQQLALALKNVGLERDASSSEAYIQALQSEFGIVDDKLRPAYQTLAVATRDTATAQKLLNLSLDISASTGKDLGAVTAALSRAYLGNNTSLSKLGVGISKADLKAKSFEEITSQLATTFAGSATAAANTFQGSIDKLGVASANASEIIGTGLIDALKGLGDENSVDDLAKSMQDAALYTADVIRGIGVLTEKLKALPGVGSFNIGMIPIVGSYLEILRNMGKSKGGGFPQGAPADLTRQFTKTPTKSLTSSQTKVEKELLKVNKENLKLAKAKATFDLQKIQIEAALKGKLSEEDRMRLKLLQAIEEENLSNIEKYQKKLEEAQEKAKELQAVLDKMKDVEVKDPFSTWKVDPLTTAIGGLTTALTDVRTGMTSTGIAWSDVAAKIAATEVKPNLTQWSSTFKMATDEAESAVETAVTALGSTTAAATAAAIAAAAAATATANAALISTSSASAQAAADAADLLSASNNAALTSTTEAATKAAIDAAAAAVAAANAALTATSSTATEAIGTSTTTATNTTVLAIAESGTATAGTIIETSQAAADALDLLYSNATNALTNATTATTTDFMATSSAALESLKDILSAQANEYAAAAAAASAQAAADAADLGGAGNAGGGINITVQTGIGDPNAIAEAISEVLREAGTRGTIGVLGID
jgi:hypothetical protein